ncbi:MAG: hypothetical protein HZB19_21620 [Chloroflexi bacterium]|nr:hypothetical protein [Chloroflexota bacterium]
MSAFLIEKIYTRGIKTTDEIMESLLVITHKSAYVIQSLKARAFCREFH